MTTTSQAKRSSRHTSASPSATTSTKPSLPPSNASSPRRRRRWTATSARSRTARCPRTPARPRLAALSEQAKGLYARASELSVLDQAERPERVTDDDLRALRNALRAALHDGTARQIKTILQDLTEEVRVDARDAIEPTYLIPAVRPQSRTMELAGLEPATSWVRSRRSPN